MSVIVWILCGLGLGLAASKMVSTTGEGTVVDILLGVGGAIVAGWIFSRFADTNEYPWFLYSTMAAVIGAAFFLTIYHLFFRRQML